MRIWVLFISMVLGLTTAQASQKRYVSVESGEEVTVNVFAPTFTDESKPLLIWFTEGYASRPSFKQLITEFNDLGYEFWQVDLLESYFIERTPNNVRGLTGEGVAAVMQHASQLVREQGRTFVPVSTGRMSLVLLRGSRLWQRGQNLQNQQNSQNTNGNSIRHANDLSSLKQVVTFFPNVFDAPKKAGDAPSLFPIVSATSLPITVVQPTQGTYKWKLPEVIKALEQNQSQVTLVAVPEVRDWYFLRREPTPLEKQAGQQVAEQFSMWLKAGQVSANRRFTPVDNLVTRQATVSIKGLVPIEPRPAPNFELTDVAGKTINLKDKQGKVILLNFWASWCPPCVKEIPSMNRLAESFDADTFEIVSVNFKESPETISAFLKSVQVDFPVLIDLDGSVSNRYEIFAFPSSFIIDAKGKLRYSVNAAIEWDESNIKALLEKMTNEYTNSRTVKNAP